MDHLIHERLYRSSETLDKIARAKIVLCGCGAVGANLAESLARMGACNLKLIDFDRVEQHNLGTQPWETGEIGQLKSVALARKLFRSTARSAMEETKKLDHGNQRKLIGVPDLIIDGFDNTAAHAAVTEYADETRIPCLHVGLTADYAEIIWNERYKVPQEPVGVDVCEYALARTTIMLAVVVAGEVIVRYLAAGIKKNYTVTLNDLKIEELM